MATSISRRGLVLGTGLGAVVAGIGCNGDRRELDNHDLQSTTQATTKQRLKHFLDYVSYRLEKERDWPPKYDGVEVSTEGWMATIMAEFSTYHGNGAQISGERERFHEALKKALLSKQKAWGKLNDQHVVSALKNHAPLYPHEADEILGATPPLPLLEGATHRNTTRINALRPRWTAHVATERFVRAGPRRRWICPPIPAA